MSKVLLVEDDYVIADGISRHLRAAGFDPVWVGKGTTALARLRYERADVCVLDLMLPELDGWEIIETARREGIGTPIVVVSARGSEEDRVRTLELGADDYIVKPFSMEELVARVRAATQSRSRSCGSTRRSCRRSSAERASTSRRRSSGFCTRWRRSRPGRHARRAPPGALGKAAHLPGSHGRRLRSEAARENRPPRASPHVHTDALRRRLPLRAHAQGVEP
jgi:DNA-binding response OmpR family regulator